MINGAGSRAHGAAYGRTFFLDFRASLQYNIHIDLSLSQKSPSDFVFAGSGAAASQGKQVFFSLYKKAEGIFLSAFFVPVNKTTK